MALWALAAAATFNLVCTGSYTTKSIYTEKSEPFNTEYRIDLDKSMYCDGECKAPRPLAKIAPTEIYFLDKTVDTPSEKSLNSMWVNRETGVFTGVFTHKNPRDRLSILIMKWDGKCERKPFTGFPTFKTKF